MSRFWLGEAEIDLERGLVLERGGEVALLPKELGLLAFLYAHAGEVVARATLLKEVWGYHENTRSRTLDTTARRLRKKIEPDPDNPRYLRTIRGKGLVLRHADSEPVAQSWRVRVAYPDTPPFVGRAEEVASALERLEAGVPLLLVGPGGVGKTSMALAVLREWDTGAKSAVFANLVGCTSATQVAAAVADALGASGNQSGVEQALSRLQAPLVVADNMEELPEDALALLLEWAKQVPMLWTSRRMWGIGETVMRVGPLHAAESMQLLVGLREHKSHVETELLEAVVRVSGGLPLALTLLGSNVELLGPDLERWALDVEATTPGPDRQRSLRSCLDLSWSHLCTDSQELLRVCSVFHRTFDIDAASALSGEPPSKVIRMLRELVERSWVVSHNGRLSILPHMRRFGLDNAEDVPALKARLAGWCASLRDEILLQTTPRVSHHKRDILASLRFGDAGLHVALLETLFFAAIRYSFSAEAIEVLRSSHPYLAEAPGHYARVMTAWLVHDLSAVAVRDPKGLELGVPQRRLASCLHNLLHAPHEQNLMELANPQLVEDPVWLWATVSLASNYLSAPAAQERLQAILNVAVRTEWPYLEQTAFALLCSVLAREEGPGDALRAVKRHLDTNSGHNMWLCTLWCEMLVDAGSLTQAIIAYRLNLDRARRTHSMHLHERWANQTVCVLHWALEDDDALAVALAEATELTNPGSLILTLNAWTQGRTPDLPPNSITASILQAYLDGTDPSTLASEHWDARHRLFARAVGGRWSTRPSGTSVGDGADRRGQSNVTD